MKKNAGDNIEVTSSNWTFKDKGVVENFDSHVSKSVPFYDESHELILRIIPHFFDENTTKIVDFGCSTGVLLEKIKDSFQNRKLDLTGLDVSKEMINHAKSTKNKSIKFTTKDLLSHNIDQVDVFISFYTLQFIKPKYRVDYLKKIYDSLAWGGAFFLFEKQRSPDARFQDIITTSYFKYKESQGYTGDHIYSKYMSLEGVLEPFSEHGNIQILNEVGFTDICPIFKYAPFGGMLCIK